MGLRNRSVAKRTIKEIKEELKNNKVAASGVQQATQDSSFGAVQILMWLLIASATAFMIYSFLGTKTAEWAPFSELTF